MDKDIKVYTKGSLDTRIPFDSNKDYEFNRYLDYDTNIYSRIKEEAGYNHKLIRAHRYCIGLNISSREIYIRYSIYFPVLKGISYDELESYKRLKSKQYRAYVAKNYKLTTKAYIREIKN